MSVLSFTPDPLSAVDALEVSTYSAVQDVTTTDLSFDLSSYLKSAVDDFGRACTGRALRYIAWVKIPVPNACPVNEIQVSVTFSDGYVWVSPMSTIYDGHSDGSEVLVKWHVPMNGWSSRVPVSSTLHLDLFDSGVTTDISDLSTPATFGIQQGCFELI